jgi:hypothetical protein
VTVLHAAVRDHLATFLVEADERSPTGLGLLRFVATWATAFSCNRINHRRQAHFTR